MIQTDQQNRKSNSRKDKKPGQSQQLRCVDEVCLELLVLTFPQILSTRP